MQVNKKITRCFRLGERYISKLRANALDSEQSELVMKFQNIFLYTRKRPEIVYHAHSIPAEMLATELKPDIQQNRFIIEASPGPGILTQKLLEAGCQRIRVFEKNKVFLEDLNDLKSKYPQLEISNFDITSIAQINASDQLNGSQNLQNCLSQLPKYSWDDEPQITLVATLGRSRECGFLRSLIYAIPSRSLLFQNGRVDLVLFVTGLEYKYLTATAEAKNLHNYRYVSILYDLFFERKFICKADRTLFLPQEPLGKGKVRFDPKYLYLMRLTPRQNVFDILTPQNRLDEFVFFVKQCMARRTAPVVPTLEKYIPRVGARLILDAGLKVFTTMGELSPQRMLEVFRVFSNMEGYQQSGFMSAYHGEKFRHFGFGTEEE